MNFWEVQVRDWEGESREMKKEKDRRRMGKVRDAIAEVVWEVSVCLFVFERESKRERNLK